MNRQNQWLIEFGARLKAEREKLGLTQNALAEKAHTKQDYIAQIERGARNPSLRTLLNILSALDISADHLLYGAVREKDGRMASIKESTLKNLNGFLARRDAAKVAAYYDIVRFLSKYVDDNPSKPK